MVKVGALGRMARAALVGSAEAKRRSRARTVLGLAVHDSLKAALGKAPESPATVPDSVLESWTMALAQARGLASLARCQAMATNEHARLVRMVG